jgi:hypothetical protein
MARGEYRIYSNVKWRTPAEYMAQLMAAPCVRPGNTDACGNILAVEDFLSDNTVNAIRIFPNPSSGKATLALPYLTDGQARVRLFDLTGKAMLDTQTDMWGGQADISLESSPVRTGLYQVRIEVSGKSYSGKLLIQR